MITCWLLNINAIVNGLIVMAMNIHLQSWAKAYSPTITMFRKSPAPITFFRL